VHFQIQFWSSGRTEGELGRKAVRLEWSCICR